MRRRSFLGAVFLPLAACASTKIDPAGTAADPKAEAPKLPRGSGVLASDFDPATLATEEGPASGHEHHHGGSAEPPSDGATVYSCPMHPEVKATSPGKCPKCGMTLEPLRKPEPKSQ